MNRSAGYDDLIGRARRRLVANLCLRQCVNAACAAMGGVILLLILGVQVMDWRWLAALTAAGAIAGLATVRRHAPPRYIVAQIVDRNLGLHDSISTAYFCNRIEPSRGSEAMRMAQRAEADRQAREAEIERAVPFTTPRSVYVMALLGLIASGLLGLRYGITRSLDLQAPLTAMLLDALRRDPEPPPEQRPDQKRQQELLSRLGLSQEEDASGRKDSGSSEESASVAESERREEQEKREQKSGQQPGGSAQAENMRQKQNQDQSAAEGGQEGEQGEEQRAGAEQSASTSSQPQQASAAQQHESNSLMDKVRDAVSGLMSRFNSQPQQGRQQQAASNSNSQSRSEQGDQRSGESGQQQAGRDGRPAPDRGAGSQGQPQQGDGSQAAQAGAGQSKGGESADASKQPGSGAGSRDGDKQIREAEQLAAMGKISEIIGRRSQNLTGDATIEVASSGTQRLRTGYSQQNSTHAESGGEILRDEIPLAYQRFVQKYFEQVRKETPAAGK